MMKQPELGKKVAEIRKSNGFTQSELAEECDVTKRTIQRIESGNVTPRTFTLKSISAALDYNFYRKPAGTNFILNGNSLSKLSDLFNLKTQTMKKLSFLSIFIGLVISGIFIFQSKSVAQDLSKEPNFSQIESLIKISKSEALDRIDKINNSVNFHNGSISKLHHYAKKSNNNFDTYVLIAELITNFGHSTKSAMDLAKVVADTKKECDLFNDIAPLIFMHLSGSNDVYVKLAQKAANASTEDEKTEVKKHILELREKQEFKNLTEAYYKQ